MGANSPSETIAMPKGGGAATGIGEKFAPDLHTGTGNLSFPLQLPAGRNGFQPSISLNYSTGSGNGFFGFGWNLSVPGVSRRTAKGVPFYDDDRDVFVLSGSEDLVRVTGSYPGTVRYRPRTEAAFARIEHVHDPSNDYWQVRSKDGLVSIYGTQRPAGAPAEWTDPAVTASGDPDRIFAWHLTETRDTFGNRIRYGYDQRDSGSAADLPHSWDQPLLTSIAYVDYGDADSPQFLIRVRFIYEPRTIDCFSNYRAGFERRTTQRCRQIVIETNSDATRPVRAYNLAYVADPANGVSQLTSIQTTGYDDLGSPVEELPPLEFGYARFAPDTDRNFSGIAGDDLPARSLADSTLELVDLFGQGLPDILEMNGYIRYWRNLGNGFFDLPRPMVNSPGGLNLGAPGTQLLDANGDGRADLLVMEPGQSGYYPLLFGGGWDTRSFHAYSQAPSFSFKDPLVKLTDLDGDGVTDAVRSGSRIECFFNNPLTGWGETLQIDRSLALDSFPDIDFSDPHLRWADVSGDGMQDIVLIHDGSVDYWPSLGRGNWGRRIHMSSSPSFPYGYDPNRVLLGDVDGDGLADLIYVDNDRVYLWLNQSGNSWRPDPIIVDGTPPVAAGNDIQLADILGSGVPGVLWSMDTPGPGRRNFWFLDFTGGRKPYLLDMQDNHVGAVTRVFYSSSTKFYLEDQRNGSVWRTPLPFPVQVVERVEMVDQISGGKLVTQYRYHHGYWDGAEREFRGFGMVEHLDTETFAEFNASPLGAAAVPPQYFSPPTVTKTWFHQGAVGEEFGDWQELDYVNEYWSGDSQMLGHTDSINGFLASFPGLPTARRAKRDALRSLRGRILRTELFADDGSEPADRPYAITEYAYGVALVGEDGDLAKLISVPAASDLPDEAADEVPRIVFFPNLQAERSTVWDRGTDPLTRLAFHADYDPFGQPGALTQVACPRGWRGMADVSTSFLATRTRTRFARPAAGSGFLYDRVATTATYEIVAASPHSAAQLASSPDSSPEFKLIGYDLDLYDGDAFNGLPNGSVGPYGALTRSERLIVTDEILSAAYGIKIPPWLTPGPVAWTADYPAEFRTMLPPIGGYLTRSGDPIFPDGYYAIGSRVQFDFQQPGKTVRGLTTVIRPPLGVASERDIVISHDKYDFLPTTVEDAIGLQQSAEYNYRVLQAAKVTDSNGNSTRFVFSPLGLVSAIYKTGSAGEGDQTHPGVTYDFNFRAFALLGQPSYVHTRTRVHHDTELDVALPARNEAIEHRAYTDGFGRTVQTRSQSEDVLFGDSQFGNGLIPPDQSTMPGPVSGRVLPAGALLNVVVSGATTYDNKGRVVEKYEPYFDTGWDYAGPGAAQFGVKSLIFFDPLGNAIRTVNPDGSEQRMVHGVPRHLNTPDDFDPTPWETYAYDANDNAGRTHAAASAAYSYHWDTPTSTTVDALGRAVETVQRNCVSPGSSVDSYVTRSEWDIRGNPLTITDVLGQQSIVSVFDLANQALRVDSIDAGLRLKVFDAAGHLIEHTDGRGVRNLSGFDVADRFTRLWSNDDPASPMTLRERVEFGDGSSSDQSSAERSANRAANRLGRIYRYYDEAGLATCELYDFKGNLLEKSRQVFKDVVLMDGWAANWEPSDASDALDPQVYKITTIFDALDRVRSIQSPDDVTGVRQELTPEYNRAGLLQRISVAGTTYIQHIAYNAKGQRTLVQYGNGLLKAYEFDRRSSRLLHLFAGPYAATPGKEFDWTWDTVKAIQDLAYGYDLAGNILQTHDRTKGCGLPATPDLLDRSFAYDALYRLLSASGRECDTPPPPAPWDDAFRCDDVTRTRAYNEAYSYDAAGNMTQLRHAAGATAWKRLYTFVPGNDRLDQVSVGGTSFAYQYDACGNMMAESTSRHFEWDHAGRMKRYRTQPAAGPASVDAFYLYDATGQRVKKLVRKGAAAESYVCINGLFEHNRQNGTANNILRVMDDHERVATIRVGPAFAGDGAAAKPVRYYLADHLGSSIVVCGDDGLMISGEEYSPFGETTFGSFARKRYRFAGKERDEESSLYYFGARYFASWLARWASCDPKGIADGLNLYVYAANNPLRFIDSTGRQSSESSVGGIDPTTPAPPETSGAGMQGTSGGELPGEDPLFQRPDNEELEHRNERIDTVPHYNVADLPQAQPDDRVAKFVTDARSAMNDEATRMAIDIVKPIAGGALPGTPSGPFSPWTDPILDKVEAAVTTPESEQSTTYKYVGAAGVVVSLLVPGAGEEEAVAKAPRIAAKAQKAGASGSRWLHPAIEELHGGIQVAQDFILENTNSANRRTPIERIGEELKRLEREGQTAKVRENARGLREFLRRRKEEAVKYFEETFGNRPNALRWWEGGG
jgi:RHS repeat-associated protein